MGTKNNTYQDVLPVTITLRDLNDEFPKFDQEDYIVSIPENIKAGGFIAFIQATDRDAEDIAKGVG